MMLRVLGAWTFACMAVGLQACGGPDEVPRDVVDAGSAERHRPDAARSGASGRIVGASGGIFVPPSPGPIGLPGPGLAAAEPWSCDEALVRRVTSVVEATKTETPAPLSPVLSPLADCRDPARRLKEKLVERMRLLVERARDIYTYNSCTGHHEPIGMPIQGSDRGTLVLLNGGGSYPPSTPAPAQPGPNLQVPDVDEPDFVRLVDGYLYAVTTLAEPDEGWLRIFDVHDPAAAHEVSSVPIRGVPRKLFVEGDRVLVYASLSSDQPAWYRQHECTYGYSCQFSGDGRPTEISIYDVHDRARPTLVRSLETQASFLSARRIGPVVHTVLTLDRFAVPGLEYFPQQAVMAGPDDAVRVFSEVADKNEKRIEQLHDEAILPSIKDTHWTSAWSGEFREHPVSCDELSVHADGELLGAVTILSLDMFADADLAKTTILSSPGITYATKDALYLAVSQSPDRGPATETVLHRFDLVGPSAVWSAAGKVEGTALNQFALDEYDGALRIATTLPRDFELPARSKVTVLEREGAELKARGAVDGLGPGEDIRSVRFVGDRGYVVTFEKTDPLYALDLRDRTRPVVLGELKIPGFSTYIHPLDGSHLLSIGYDADDQGNFAWFRGVLLQLFDVTDPSSPRLVARESIGTRGSSSEALTNHLAFNYDAQRGLLALPIVVCEGGTGNTFGTTSFQGLQLWGATVADGLRLLGGLPVGTHGGTCTGWWTNGQSEIERSIFVGEHVIAVTARSAIVANVADLGQPVAELPIQF